MHIRTKIDLKKYIGLSLFTTAVSCFFVSNVIEVLVVLVIYLATLINQAILVELVVEMSESAKYTKFNDEKPRVDRGRILSLSLLKIIIMLGAISFGVLFMGNRIIIPVLNYVFIIFILAISLKQKVRAP